ncbi:MAG: IS110 family transposase [Akkermansiaceae bacterium]|nr:IS110 family transposase [Akkermansiaceae bacterium]MCP5543417.1 IS110 family transposase [Akkermansiaceae bacterium]MCP5548683.1 IS110 family transposase [Akkermansiaceae bacterium]
MKTKPTTSSANTIGIDLGDRKHAVCVLDAKGRVIRIETIANTRAALTALSRRHRRALVVMEVGTQSPWISRLFESLGHRVLVANPRKVRAIYQNERKSDRRDCEMLARIARADETLLHPVKHGSEEMQRDMLQIKLRDNLVRRRVDLISSVRFTLKSLGVRLPSPHTESFAKYARRLLEAEHPDLLGLVDPMLRVIEEITAQIRVLEGAIDEMAATKYPEVELLTQIKGVGTITSLAFLLTVGDPTRFNRRRDVAAFFGLVPKRDQSGDTDKQMRISKCGDAYVRKLLVSAAQYILGPHGPDTDLRRHGLKLAERGGPRAKKKAVVAVARKLAVLLLAIWYDESIYEPGRLAA